MARKKKRDRRGNGGQPPSDKRWHDDLAPETKKSVTAVLFFVMAAVMALAYWSRAGALGRIIFSILDSAVGKAYLLAPLTFLLVGFSLFLSFRKHLYAAVFIGAGLFLAFMLALIQLFLKNNTAGWIGFAVNWPFERFFDFWGALVIEAAILLISILIMLNIPLWKPREEGSEEKTDAGALDKAIGTLSETVAGVKEAMQKKGDAPPAQTSSVMVDAKDQKAHSAGGEEFTIAKAQKRRSAYVFPPLNLLSDDKGTPSSGDIRANANIIKRTLLNFGIDVEMGEVSVGPTVTQYTLKPAEGVKLSRILALQNDLSLALAAHPLRIEAPIPGKSLVGIEVPNRSIALVGLRSLIEHDIFQQSPAPLLFALGRDVAGAPVYANLAKMPHLLVAGSTGAGKSVAIHSMITSLLYRNPPELLKFLMVDPKRVELASYVGIPHLLTAPIIDAKKTIAALRWAVKEMERRYEVLAASRVRDLASYNELVTKKSGATAELMPYLVIMIDELADLMVAYPREVEGSIIRLAQMARAVGIHLVVSTQRPSVEVITGLIKANITSRVAFQVASQIDSRTILDVAGAEKLLGNGDMLFLAGDTAKPRRIQGGFVSEGEVQKIVKFIREQADAQSAGEGNGDSVEEAMFNPATSNALADALDGGDEFDGDEDPLYEDARETVVRAGKASASYLQRRLKIGYARAARLLDILEERGVIGPGEGAKPREILASPDDEPQ